MSVIRDRTKFILSFELFHRESHFLDVVSYSCLVDFNSIRCSEGNCGVIALFIFAYFHFELKTTGNRRFIRFLNPLIRETQRDKVSI